MFNFLADFLKGWCYNRKGIKMFKITKTAMNYCLK